MKDEALAQELVRRLNSLLESSPDMGRFLYNLAESRVPVVNSLVDHPTLQVNVTAEGDGQCGFLGLLNGLVGVLPDGPREGWGYITGHFDEEKQVVEGFSVTGTFRVILNGGYVQVPGPHLSYEQVIEILRGGPDSRPHTVAYARADGDEPTGTLAPGESFQVKHGTVINAFVCSAT